MTPLAVPQHIDQWVDDLYSQGKKALYASFQDAFTAIEHGRIEARKRRITTSADGRLAEFDPVWMVYASGNGARYLITWTQRENGTRHVLTVEGPLP